MMSLLGAARADEFNDERLRAGQEAYAARHDVEAIDQFRIAAFGSLDKPVVLSECLVRLALAQSGAEKTADTRATLDRFLEVERRFGGYAQANLQPEIRSAFKVLLFSRVPQATVLSIPSMAGLIETEEQKIGKLPPAERRKALEAAARREPGNVRWMLAFSRDSLERGDPKEAERWASKALATQSDNADALALRARARVARGEYVDALKDLAALAQDERASRPELYADNFVSLVEVRNFDGASEMAGHVPESLSNRADVVRAKAKLTAEQERHAGKTTTAALKSAPKPATPAPAPAAPASTAASGASKPTEAPLDLAARSRAALEESRRLVSSGKSGAAEKLLTVAVKGDPGNRDLRLELLEAACLVRSYQNAVAQVPLVTPIADSESPSLFYAAVALYETGKTEEARAYLQRAMPRVSGPLVDEYTKKILGPAAAR